MLDGLTVNCAVDTSEYRRTFSRTSPHPITLHGKPGCLTAWPFLHVLRCTAGGYGATAPSIPAEHEGLSRLRGVKGAASAVFSEYPKIGRSQKGMLRRFLAVVHGCPFGQLFGDYSADGKLQFPHQVPEGVSESCLLRLRSIIRLEIRARRADYRRLPKFLLLGLRWLISAGTTGGI
jgi:hypothetical protein